MSSPSILILFDPLTWRPTAIFPNGQDDVETAKILEIADKMVEAPHSGRGKTDMAIQEINKLRPGDFCLLCSGKPSIIAIFAPDEPEAWGSTRGKNRLFRYFLCSGCHGKPDTPDRAEKIIRAELASGDVTHGE